MEPTSKKVLIIRYSSIGDIVLTTPVIRCIRQQWNAEIHFLVKESFVPVLHTNPYITRIHNKEQTTLEELKNLNFDHVFDLQKNRQSIRLVRRLGRPHTSFDKLNVKKWLLVNTKINILPKQHLVDRYFEALFPLGINNDHLGLDIFYDEDTISPEIKGLVDAHYDVLVLGAAHNTKRISMSKAREILSLQRHTTILIGGHDVAEMGSLLKKEFPHAIKMTGKTSLAETSYLIKHAGLVFTGDTGMMHIAAAFQKKIVVLWGNTVPDFGMYPYFGMSDVGKYLSLEVNLGCRPCSKLGFNSCPLGHFDCMEKINVSAPEINAFEHE
ncbi:MAG: glycosyltransferase family 9 protein [Saprospiraceae bacterium]|nr:glycosyltransferase family 9 protein [Saprospiraceae bacterium]